MAKRHKHHDLLVKRVFSQPENVIGHLRSILTQPVLETLDLEGLRIVDKSFIDEKLRARESDALYSVPIRGQTGYVYVLREHQSKSRRFMPLRLLAYMVRIWEHHLDQQPRAETLPVILPVVLYHHRRSWRAPKTFHAQLTPELVTEPSLGAVTPSFEFILDDISEAPDEELRARPMPLYGRLALWALRDARFDRLERTLPVWTELLGTLLGLPGGRQAVETLICYIYSVQDQASAEALFEKIPDPEVREAAMTIAEQLEQRGRQEGQREGRREQSVEIVLRLLAVKFGPPDEAVRARIASADLETLDRYVERVVTATSVGEVLEAEPR